MAAAVFERDVRLGLGREQISSPPARDPLFFLLPFKSRDSSEGCLQEVSLLTVGELLVFFFKEKKRDWQQGWPWQKNKLYVTENEEGREAEADMMCQGIGDV